MDRSIDVLESTMSQRVTDPNHFTVAYGKRAWKVIR